MSAQTREAVIGIQRCGCITYANAAPEHWDKDDAEAVSKIVSKGGRVERMTVDEARKRPHFLPIECPHDPKGWEREKPKAPNPIRYSRVSSRNVSVVYARVSRWSTGRGFRAGEVAKRKGQWWATEGWMDAYEAAALDGNTPRSPTAVFGPFDSQRQAAEYLLPLAEKAADELAAELDAARSRRRGSMAETARSSEPTPHKPNPGQ